MKRWLDVFRQRRARRERLALLQAQIDWRAGGIDSIIAALPRLQAAQAKALAELDRARSALRPWLRQGLQQRIERCESAKAELATADARMATAQRDKVTLAHEIYGLAAELNSNRRT